METEHSALQTVGKGLRRNEVLMLVEQALSGLGFEGISQQLARESGVHYQSQTTADFRTAIWDGRYDEALRLLGSLGLSVKADLLQAQFRIMEEKLLEELSRGATDAAMKVLRQDLARLNIRQDRLHRLAGCLLCTTPEALEEHISWPGTRNRRNREQLLRDIQEFIPPEIMLPDGRLEVLLEQAVVQQLNKLDIRRSAQMPVSLLTDSCFSRGHIPTRTTQVLTDHTEEVWHIQFSHDGLHLASASKDGTAIIWRVGAQRQLTKRHTLSGHTAAITYCTWNPDDTMLATCSLDATLRVWIAATGLCYKAVQAHEGPVTTAAWLPNGTGIFSAAEDKRIHLTMLPSVLLSPKGMAWSSSGINELLMLRDGRLLAAPTMQNTILSWSAEAAPFAEQPGWEPLLTEEGCSIVSCSASADGSRLLLNTSTRAVHMWSIPGMPGSQAEGTACLLQRFRGPKERQSRYIVRSCFGGYNDSFVLSGSEECKVFIWLAATGELLASLEGHSGTVNAVSWNPTDPHMFASASDDRSIHIWGLDPNAQPAGGVLHAGAPLR